MALARYDTEQITRNVDLVDLAGRYTTLRRWGAHEWAGPCPRGACIAKQDGFHVHDDGWFTCYKCRENKHGDAIEFVQWLGLAPDFRGACEWLTGAPMAAPAQPVAPQAKPKDNKPTWHDDAWQADARATLARARDVLDSPAAGDPGRAYLAGRGLTRETWRAWGLGYDPARWDVTQQRKRPAVVMPWVDADGVVMAVKYRFTDSGDSRFTQKGGGEQIVFGLQMMTGAQTLWLTEGELNAISLWQALRAAGRDDDALSFGSETSADHLDRRITDRAARYARVIVWADKPDNAQAAMTAIPGACGVRSPVVDGVELDANALLQAGALARFALAAWQNLYGADSSAVEADLRARIRAAEERIEKGETMLKTETDPARVTRYRVRLAELTAQVNDLYDQVGALPIDWPFPG